MKRKLFFFVFLICGLPSFAAQKYASPSGSSSNSGNSISQAWSLSYALGNSSRLSPGDSLILADGVYPGNYVSEVSGSAGRPIIITPLNEGKAIIDVGINRTAEVGLRINGQHTWFIGLHITSSSTIRKSDTSNGNAIVLYESGIAVYGDDTKLINCWIYDIVGGGLELWRSGMNLEVYGCVIFNNGSQDDLRGTGHGMYVQHDRPDYPKLIRNNFVFQNASQGINVYTTDPINKGIIIDRNVSFNTGVIADFNPFVFRPPHNLTIGSKNNLSSDMEVLGNIFYSDLQGNRLSSDQISNVSLGRTYFPNSDIKFTENRIYGGRNQVEFVPALKLDFSRNSLFNVNGKFIELLGTDKSYPNAFWNSNTYINLSQDISVFDGLIFPDWKSKYDFDANSQVLTEAQKTIETLVVQNLYDPSVYYVTILNLGNQEQINVDFSDQGIRQGVKYEIRDIQNPFDAGQKINGEFQGSVIQFPMNWTKSLQPNGNMPHSVKHTDQTFGTFLLKFANNSDLEFPAFKDSVAIFVNALGIAELKLSDFLKNTSADDFDFSTSTGFNFNCTDLGKNEITIIVTHKQSQVKKSVTIDVWVMDKIAPNVQVKSYTGRIDIVNNQKFELKAEYFIESLSDNCAEDLEVILTPMTLGCNDINATVPIKVILLVKDKSRNYTEAVTYLTIEATESKKISISGPTPGVKGSPVKLTLGSEFAFTVEAWYRGDEQLAFSNTKELTISEAGSYKAKLKPVNGCPVFSNSIEVTFEAPAELPLVKKKIELELDKDGKAILKSEQVFTNWPISSEYTVVLSNSTFSCENLTSNTVVVKISDSKGVVQEKSIEVIVRDNANPVLVIKNVEVIVDLAIGNVELNSEDFIASLMDNCGIKEVKLSRQSVGCEDIGREITVEVEAIDYAGNIKQQLAKVIVQSSNSKPVTFSGSASICEGENHELTLASEADFEVVRWRRNGTDIFGATGKTLEIEADGSYHADIRYAGGCIFETEKFVIESLAKPSGEIVVDGNILKAPEGNYTYQWFRNGDKLAGDTKQTLTVNQMGEFTVELTNEVGCIGRLDAVTMTISGILNPGILVSEELKIYPNPASSEVVIQALGDLEFAENSMKIYDPNGKDVSSNVEVIRQSPNSVTLAIPRLSAGTYVIMVESQDSRMFVGKLVKR